MANQIFKFSGYLEPEEVRSIINAIPYVSRHPERDQLFLELLWQSGARVTEAITLVPERVGTTSIVFRNLKQVKGLRDTDGKVLRDEKGKPIKVRDEGAVKEVEVSADLCQKLKDFCDKHRIKEGEYMFKANKGKGYLSRWYVWWITDKAASLARVYRFGKRHPKTGGKFKGAYPHLFRHSSAMHMLEETGSIMIVQQQLGHASVLTTQGYAFVKERQVRKAISKIKW